MNMVGSAPHAHIFLGEVADVLCHKERDSEIDSEPLLGCYVHYAVHIEMRFLLWLAEFHHLTSVGC